VLAACSSGDAFSFGNGAARGLAWQFTGDTATVIEFDGPPFREARRSNFVVGPSPLLAADPLTAGGFFVLSGDGGQAFPYHVIQYDAAWHLVQNRRVSDVTSTTGLQLMNPRVTPNGQYVTFYMNGSGAGEWLVLDRASLGLVRRISLSGLSPVTDGFPFPRSETGSQSLMIRNSCPAATTYALLWINVATGVVADSAVVPCDVTVAGAVTHRRLLVSGSAGGSPFVAIFDVDAGTTAPSIPFGLFFSDDARGRLYRTSTNAIDVFDSSLHPQGSVNFTGGWDPSGAVDAATGAILLAIVDPSVPGATGGFAMLDPVGRREVGHAYLGKPTFLMH
jgi:hypothetical protein